MLIRNVFVRNFLAFYNDGNDLDALRYGINYIIPDRIFYEIFANHLEDISSGKLGDISSDMCLQYFQVDYGIETENKDVIKFLLKKTNINHMNITHAHNWINFLIINKELSKKRILDLYRNFYWEYSNTLDLYLQKIEFYQYLKQNPEVIETLNILQNN
jgi:hypothetical protein